MKKLLKWMFNLPTRSGVADVAGRYARYTWRYLLISVVLSAATALSLVLIFLFAPHDAARAGRGVENCMGGVMGWAAAHLNTLLIWGLPFAIAWRLWTGRSEIAAACREIKTIIRALRDQYRSAK
ncbi:MAG: hypothetical protein ACYCQK_02740 [Acidiferrobacteraceae bacterium]